MGRLRWLVGVGILGHRRYRHAVCRLRLVGNPLYYRQKLRYLGELLAFVNSRIQAGAHFHVGDVVEKVCHTLQVHAAACGDKAGGKVARGHLGKLQLVEHVLHDFTCARRNVV